MTDGRDPSTRMTRRQLVGRGAVLALVGGGVGLPAFMRGGSGSSLVRPASASAAIVPQAATSIHLAATDGHILLPGRGSPSGPGGDPLYVFGFVRVPVGVTPNQLDAFKGNVQHPAPIIGVRQPVRQPCPLEPVEHGGHRARREVRRLRELPSRQGTPGEQQPHAAKVGAIQPEDLRRRVVHGIRGFLELGDVPADLPDQVVPRFI